jgi:hypothetical protein
MLMRPPHAGKSLLLVGWGLCVCVCVCVCVTLEEQTKETVDRGKTSESALLSSLLNPNPLALAYLCLPNNTRYCHSDKKEN